MVAPPDNDVLWARGLHHSYGQTQALGGVAVGVGEGRILAVRGSRGAGKSTLLRCLSGQLTPREGEVWFDGTPLSALSRRDRERLRLDHFGWVDTEPQLVPELTAWENAALPLLLRGVGHRAARHTAHEWLERLDVGPCARRRIAQLDRAESQRIAIARALAAQPRVLFADDPTAILHRTQSMQILRTITTAARSHQITVVLATHEASDTLADLTVTLDDGRLTGAEGSNAADGTGSRAQCSLSV
ncbi:ATP-binding cassette domain-containing protein [Streptomyces sp. NPDC059740]|uniref:ATP-binding cassette domain-containing protein n=1 Tax=Streptomyces sp. NPDC059740 TaxID=3346926 RepID=UPI0036492825